MPKLSADLRSKMICHGSVVIILALIAGFPYALAILGGSAGGSRAWAAAHTGGIMNGLLVLVAAGAARRSALNKTRQKVMAYCLIATAWGNLLGYSVGAITGTRGLEIASPLANMVVWTLFIVAVLTAFVGLGLLAWGAAAYRSRED
ncbi:MAG: hypothetical protein VB852_05975 [Deltaproteobacteria bacterium]